MERRAEEARLKAEEVLALLGDGSDLAEVGRITWKTVQNPPEEISSQRDQNHLPDEYAKAIFALGIGETSGIVD